MTQAQREIIAQVVGILDILQATYQQDDKGYIGDLLVEKRDQLQEILDQDGKAL